MSVSSVVASLVMVREATAASRLPDPPEPSLPSLLAASAAGAAVTVTVDVLRRVTVFKPVRTEVPPTRTLACEPLVGRTTSAYFLFEVNGPRVELASSRTTPVPVRDELPVTETTALPSSSRA